MIRLEEDTITISTTALVPSPLKKTKKIPPLTDSASLFSPLVADGLTLRVAGCGGACDRAGNVENLWHAVKGSNPTPPAFAPRSQSSSSL
uniref:Uncharacterized protein n=1 Tax=Physcomitrium patens TaxID=3218 RepID=A0A2K1K1N2_PHYPA|nr:hypothetical protein PHYPA_012150 [Physcomitrium patens]